MSNNQKITDAEIAKLTRLEKLVTPGPWVGCVSGGGVRQGNTSEVLLMPAATQRISRDIDFVVAVRNAFPRLLAERALMVKEIERLQRARVILDERDRQDAKWGPQYHSLMEWVTILTEEVGELAAAVLCHRFGNDDHPELDWKKEAIQVAAVALSITEQYVEADEGRKTDG